MARLHWPNVPFWVWTFRVEIQSGLVHVDSADEVTRMWLESASCQVQT